MHSQRFDPEHAEQLISMLLSDPDAFCRGGGIAQLVDEVFRGYPIDAVRRLAVHDNDRVVRAAIRSLSEMGYKAAPALPEALIALQHADDYIRYYALDTVLLGTIHGNQHEFQHVVAKLDDPDKSVRQKALRFLARASDSQIAAAISRLEQDGSWTSRCVRLRRMLDLASIDDEAITEMITNDTAFDKQLVVALAERGYAGHPHWLRRAAHDLEEEYQSEAAHLLALHDATAAPDDPS